MILLHWGQSLCVNGEEERIKCSVGFLGLPIHGRSVTEIYEGGAKQTIRIFGERDSNKVIPKRVKYLMVFGHTHTKQGRIQISVMGAELSSIFSQNRKN